MHESTWQHHYEVGKKAFEEGSLSVAIEHLEKVAREKENFPDVYNMLGQIYYANSRHGEAIKAFKKALAINPDYNEVSLNLSIVYNELGQFDVAREVYSKAKRFSKDYLDPFVKGKLANMHADIGRIYKDLGMYEEAASEYRMALALRPAFVDIRTELAVALRGTKDFLTAIKELKESVELKPDYAAARIQLGLTYFLMGEHGKATAEWATVLKKYPEDKLARMYMNLVEPDGCAAAKKA